MTCETVLVQRGDGMTDGVVARGPYKQTPEAQHRNGEEVGVGQILLALLTDGLLRRNIGRGSLIFLVQTVSQEP